LSRRNNDGTFSNFTIKDGLSANRVVSFYEDADNLWIGTEGGGLCRMSNYELRMTNGESSEGENRNPKFSSYGAKNGLFSDSVFEILEDDRGYLWMSCFSGIFRVKKQAFDDLDRGKIQTLSCASFGKTEGMSSVQCNGIGKPAGWKALDGRLWFPTVRGIVVVDPNSIRENDSPPAVVMEEILADKKTLPPPGANKLSVLPGKGELEFHYAALSFRAPEKNRFKYKLEGVDSDWVAAGNRRTAYYNNLRPRDYTFRVIGCNNDGVWNQAGASVELALLPHYWQTKWFFTLIGLTAIGLVAGTARYVTWKKIQQKILRLEEQHAVERERTRIAQDMHDDLGARLTAMMVMSTLAQSTEGREQKSHLQNIFQSSREVVQNLDGLVWAVNPGNDSLENTAAYIYDFAARFLQIASIRCRIEAPDELPDCDLSSEARHNLFLVVKETLNNVVKHAVASEVTLRLQLERDTLSISIEDNGKGFAQAGLLGKGNGLGNMQKRIEALGGLWEISSELGKGTKVRLAVPLPDK
jgi:signal transduction histidine kinase